MFIVERRIPMNNLIPIIEKEGNQAVSARKLHFFLESKQDFSNWIANRIKKYGLIENQDFEVFNKFIENPNGGRPLTEYALSLDCAKELSMVEGNEKGKQARRYFIACEKKLRQHQIPQSYSEALMLAASQAEQIEKQQKLIEAQRGKVEFVDRILDTDEKIDIGQAAKILGLPFGRNTLFQELRKQGVFFVNRNEPKQEFVNRGYFELKEKWIERNNHDGFMIIKVLVTQKGLEFISKLFQVESKSKTLAKIS